MAFAITTTEAQAGAARGTVYTLADAASGATAEVWPALGFNCVRWSVRTASGGVGPVLYTAPDWLTNPVPTRSGHPILFPFPNRLKHGRFTFEGKDYQLPLNEATGQHAIHGFTPRSAWRVVGTTADADAAEITGEFRIAIDRPDVLACWPGDLILTVTYRLTVSALEVRCRVQNPGPGNVPFGLGYHPYFCLPSLPGGAIEAMVLHAPARSLWVAEDSLATGEKVPTPAGVDFGAARPVGDAVLDHLYGDLPADTSLRATLSHPRATESIAVYADPAFRELLLFTPGHRRAVAVEPYTCTTDAPNLSARGVDAGLRMLGPGAEFAATVRYAVGSA